MFKKLLLKLGIGHDPNKAHTIPAHKVSIMTWPKPTGKLYYIEPKYKSNDTKI
jgi:hypothetical protein